MLKNPLKKNGKSPNVNVEFYYSFSLSFYISFFRIRI